MSFEVEEEFDVRDYEEEYEEGFGDEEGYGDDEDPGEDPGEDYGELSGEFEEFEQEFTTPVGDIVSRATGFKERRDRSPDEVYKTKILNEFKNNEFTEFDEEFAESIANTANSVYPVSFRVTLNPKLLIVTILYLREVNKRQGIFSDFPIKKKLITDLSKKYLVFAADVLRYLRILETHL